LVDKGLRIGEAFRYFWPMSATRDDKYRCKRETPFGYWWRYTHSQGEPDDTLKAA
jgi:hypothetical protein